MTPTPDHVLLVDDDPEIRQLTAKYLEQNSIQCSTAANSQEMRRMLQMQRVDLLVLDVMMPGEDGLTICRNLRADGSAYAQLPILMLTARTDDADRILGLEMGADDYLGVARALYLPIYKPQTAPTAGGFRVTHSMPCHARCATPMGFCWC